MLLYLPTESKLAPRGIAALAVAPTLSAWLGDLVQQLYENGLHGSLVKLQ